MVKTLIGYPGDDGRRCPCSQMPWQLQMMSGAVRSGSPALVDFIDRKLMMALGAIIDETSDEVT